MTLLDFIVQLCSWYIFCTVDVCGLSFGVVGILLGFFGVFDLLFAVAIVIAFLFLCRECVGCWR